MATNFYKPYDNCVFLHGCYISPENSPHGNDAIIACVKDVETGESKLHYIKNPQTQVFVTRAGLRNYEFKREYTKISDCDMYVTPYKDQYSALAQALGIRNSDPFFTKRAVEASPFAYTWDISPLVRMKCEYMDHTKKSATGLKIGMLDLETSVLGDEQILCASVIDWPTRVVHCFILNDPWLRATDTTELDKRTEQEYKTFVEGLNPKARKVWDAKPVRAKYYLVPDEATLITKLFKCINYHKMDFLGIWNMGYDIPYIKKRAEFRQLELSELFCHQDVPSEFRMFEWKEDKSKVDHFTDTWHTVVAPGYTCYFDAMCLYSRLRKVKGRDVFYTLDYIGNKNIGTGKMKFGTNASHRDMQTNDKVGYCVYNTMDVIIPAMMDEINHDVASMVELTDCSMIADFSKQTVQLKAQFYRYLRERNCVPGSVAGSIKQEYDEVIGNIGGAVLNPTLMKVKGVPCLIETPKRSSIYRLAADIDVSSFYPSVTIAQNISRETKIASVLWVEGDPHSIEEIQAEKNAQEQKLMAKANSEYHFSLFGRVPCVAENAVAVCHEYFGMPNYEEMLKLVTEETLCQTNEESVNS